MEPSVGGISRWPRIAAVLLIYGGLLAGGHWGSGWLIDLIGVDLGPGAQSQDLQVMVVGLVLYTALLATPFVPGMEISLGLLAVFGPRIALAVFLATVVALGFSHLIGRLLPVSMLATFFRFFGLERARGLVERLEPLDADQRLGVLIDHAPKRIVPMLLNHRYIAIVVALNVPGNAIIGGGGGIALLAGMSGLFTLPRFLLTVALAALPVPLFVMFVGS